MEHPDDEKIKALLTDEPATTNETARLNKVMRRVRAGVGQRDSLLFAFVRFWTVIAEMVAPLFAQLAKRQALVEARRKLPQQTKNDSSNV